MNYGLVKAGSPLLTKTLRARGAFFFLSRTGHPNPQDWPWQTSSVKSWLVDFTYHYTHRNYCFQALERCRGERLGMKVIAVVVDLKEFGGGCYGLDARMVAFNKPLNFSSVSCGRRSSRINDFHFFNHNHNSIH
ncbi:hypothetical protein QVD17_09160 [Tagetes erecta]|uniref:Uncharacterized protein n=1 Tax=Tagetes erecta TaxID=13708 RepID=A0AAD8L6S8_TARER|nr:hypothetical protein QVD17_09160 [Tagetes erecta]